MNCDMMESANVSCYEPATHQVPGTPLGPIAMCDRHFAEWLTDNEAVPEDPR